MSEPTNKIADEDDDCGVTTIDCVACDGSGVICESCGSAAEHCECEEKEKDFTDCLECEGDGFILVDVDENPDMSMVSIRETAD